MMWFFLLLLCCPLDALPLTSIAEEGIQADFRGPNYSDGVLETTEGGVITAKGLRIQARHIRYTLNRSVEAEGDLLVQYGSSIFSGERFEYDFETEQGTIFEGKSAVSPWFFGARRVELLPEGVFHLEDGYITTSENACPDWQLSTKSAYLVDEHLLTAHDIQFKLGSVPLLWLPKFYFDLESLDDVPIRFRMRWGGKKGPRAGISYRAFTYGCFKGFLRLDCSSRRGVGGGIETEYATSATQSFTRSYIAKDGSETRYRLEGVVNHCFPNNATTIDLSYDKLSDRDMADYLDETIDLKAAERTKLHARHKQQESWIANTDIHLRLNSFQTVKQELPTFTICFRPYTLQGIVSEQKVKVSYLDFEYADEVEKTSDFNAARAEYQQKIYRPFQIPFATVTPEIGVVAIGYSRKESVLVGIGGIELKSSLYKRFGDCKHTIEPYVKYQYYTNSNPKEHDIFDITDGWSHLSLTRVGIRNALYRKSDCSIERPLTVDLYTIRNKIYLDTEWDITPRLRETLSLNNDYINTKTEWTVSDDAALAFEWRHRNAFSWRKVDHDNFIIDSFYSEAELLKSPLSDARETFIAHLFCRLQPNLALEIKTRYGWHHKSPFHHYFEYEIDLLTTLSSVWNLRLSYQHREDDQRIALYLNLGDLIPK